MVKNGYKCNKHNLTYRDEMIGTSSIRYTVEWQVCKLGPRGCVQREAQVWVVPRETDECDLFDRRVHQTRQRHFHIVVFRAWGLVVVDLLDDILQSGAVEERLVELGSGNDLRHHLHSHGAVIIRISPVEHCKGPISAVAVS